MRMAEGPQVLRRTEWLHRYLAGRKVVRSVSERDDISADQLTGLSVQRVACRGKNIFVEFEGGQILYNHLLMRGNWKKLDGAQLFLPTGAWLGLYLGPYTICNIGGQRLKLIDQEQMQEQLESLGPDAMAKPYATDEIRSSLLQSRLSVSEALLDQSVVAGVGNIAKSEILFVARIDPRVHATELSERQLATLLDAIPTVLWNSYNVGGRWECRVYRKVGDACEQCGTTIRSISLRPSKRATYFCPKCQGSNR